MKPTMKTVADFANAANASIELAFDAADCIDTYEEAILLVARYILNRTNSYLICRYIDCAEKKSDSMASYIIRCTIIQTAARHGYIPSTVTAYNSDDEERDEVIEVDDIILYHVIDLMLEDVDSCCDFL